MICHNFFTPSKIGSNFQSILKNLYTKFQMYNMQINIHTIHTNLGLPRTRLALVINTLLAIQCSAILSMCQNITTHRSLLLPTLFPFQLYYALLYCPTTPNTCLKHLKYIHCSSLNTSQHVQLWCNCSSCPVSTYNAAPTSNSLSICCYFWPWVPKIVHFLWRLIFLHTFTCYFLHSSSFQFFPSFKQSPVYTSSPLNQLQVLGQSKNKDWLSHTFHSSHLPVPTLAQASSIQFFCHTLHIHIYHQLWHHTALGNPTPTGSYSSRITSTMTHTQLTTKFLTLLPTISLQFHTASQPIMP